MPLSSKRRRVVVSDSDNEMDDAVRIGHNAPNSVIGNEVYLKQIDLPHLRFSEGTPSNTMIAELSSDGGEPSDAEHEAYHTLAQEEHERMRADVDVDVAYSADEEAYGGGDTTDDEEAEDAAYGGGDTTDDEEAEVEAEAEAPKRSKRKRAAAECTLSLNVDGTVVVDGVVLPDATASAYGFAWPPRRTVTARVPRLRYKSWRRKTLELSRCVGFNKCEGKGLQALLLTARHSLDGGGGERVVLDGFYSTRRFKYEFKAPEEEEGSCDWQMVCRNWVPNASGYPRTLPSSEPANARGVTYIRALVDRVTDVVREWDGESDSVCLGKTVWDGCASRWSLNEDGQVCVDIDSTAVRHIKHWTHYHSNSYEEEVPAYTFSVTFHL